MSVNFFKEVCKSSSKKKVFGVCDDVDADGNTSKPAYLAEDNGAKWIATVDNYYRENIDFYAVDNCVTFPLREDGKLSKRCDGFLVSNDIIAFIELKSRNEYGSKWVSDAEKQLKISIYYFEKEKKSSEYNDKRAYIVNNMRPQARISQAERMERFLDETGYLLFVKARINLHNLDG